MNIQMPAGEMPALRQLLLELVDTKLSGRTRRSKFNRAAKVFQLLLNLPTTPKSLSIVLDPSGVYLAVSMDEPSIAATNVEDK